jgi:hypothetical protein
MLVVIVIAGVVVLVATVPANPFAVATLTAVTVPEVGVTQLSAVPLVVRYFPTFPL